MKYIVISSGQLQSTKRYYNEHDASRRPPVPAVTGLIDQVNCAIEKGGTLVGGIHHSNKTFYQALLMPD